MTTHETGIGLTAHAETLDVTLAQTFATYLQAEAIGPGTLHLLFVIRADGAPWPRPSLTAWLTTPAASPRQPGSPTPTARPPSTTWRHPPPDPS